MNISSFLEHWKIAENPFRAEEARHDPVFARLSDGPTAHPDFAKIVGDLTRPATSIVFGEKGSGKTAIRLQLAQRIEEHNAAHPNQRLFIIAYDDLNPVLDRFVARQGLTEQAEPRQIGKALGKLRLVDHMDAMLHIAVLRIVDAILGFADDPGADGVLTPAAVRELRKAPAASKHDLLLLAALYDRRGGDAERMAALRKRLQAPGNGSRTLWTGLAWFGWVPAAVLVAIYLWIGRDNAGSIEPWLYGLYALLALWAGLIVKRYLWDRWRVARLGRRLAKELRTVPRQAEGLGAAVDELPRSLRDPAGLPGPGNDDHRYAMFAHLRRILGHLGCAGLVILVDRLDEPTLINGDPERMRAVVWPLMHNKFLQQEATGVKALLPVELRHEIFRESANFFQEARLDKQSLVERLAWTGPTLYDLCNARLEACRLPEAKEQPISLVDLFSDDVGRQDIVDALDQMHQPRDAFKLLYQCIQEHCSNVTEEQQEWRIPRLVLETVRRQQSDRVQQFYRGMRPA